MVLSTISFLTQSESGLGVTVCVVVLRTVMCCLTSVVATGILKRLALVDAVEALAATVEVG